MSDQTQFDRLLPRNITDEMEQSYLAYAMSVIVGRALPDVRDGLKPVHRRCLFAMHEQRNDHTKQEFRCDQHKTTTLTVAKSALKVPEDGKTAKGVVPGKLTLNGATNDVKVNYEVKRTGSQYEVKSASFSFDYTKFGVAQICKLGVCVANNVDISVSNLKLADK